MQRSEKATINTQPNKTKNANKKAKKKPKTNQKSEKTPSPHNHTKKKNKKPLNQLNHQTDASASGRYEPHATSQ